MLSAAGAEQTANDWKLITSQFSGFQRHNLFRNVPCCSGTRPWDRRLWTGNVRRVCSATYQIF